MRYRLSMIAIAGLALAASPAAAAPVITAINDNASAAPVSFTFMGSVFTFGATGDLFNPLSVQNSAPAAFGSSGGFLGIPVAPTTSFVDRGTVTFGPDDRFASFPTPTVVPFSNGNNFIGLRATVGSDNFFGFAYTTNTTVNSIGFENLANTTITATTAVPLAAVPEAGTWAMMVIGVGALGTAARYRRRRTGVAYRSPA